MRQVNELEMKVYYRNCTDLAIFQGLPVIPGINDSVQVICTYRFSRIL